MNAVFTWIALTAVVAFVALIFWSVLRARSTARLTLADLSPPPDPSGDILVTPGQTLSGTVRLEALRDIDLQSLIIAIRLNTNDRPEHAQSDELAGIETPLSGPQALAAGTSLSLPFSVTFPTSRPRGPGLAVGPDDHLPGLRPRSAPRAGPGDVERHIYWTLDARADLGSHTSATNVYLLPVEN